MEIFGRMDRQRYFNEEIRKGINNDKEINLSEYVDNLAFNKDYFSHKLTNEEEEIDKINHSMLRNKKLNLIEQSEDNNEIENYINNVAECIKNNIFIYNNELFISFVVE